MTDHFQTIYRTYAAEYDALVQREDYQGELPRALTALYPPDDRIIVDLGAGTGRVAGLLAPRAARLLACDGSAHMLAVARTRLTPYPHARTLVADNRRLPLPAACADLAVAGWSLGHSVGWYPDHWQAEIGRALAEMQRIVRPGGMLIVIETLGTGSTAPTPPNAGLAAYYAWLENTHGFTRTWIRTDYRFASLAEAEQLTGFFFGADFAARVVAEQWQIVPECTGIWWRQ